MLNSVKYFVSFEWDDHVFFFSFEFIYIVGYIDGFLYIEPIMHCWNEAYLIMVDDHFDVFLDLVCENFIEYFCIDILPY